MVRRGRIGAGVSSIGLVVLVALGATAGLPLRAAQAARLKVGGAIKPPTKIHDVRAAYPQDAKDAGVEGVVILQIVIGTDGSVVETSTVRSLHPSLDQAAAVAVQQWRFTETLLNGEPVELEMYVTINFTLK